MTVDESLTALALEKPMPNDLLWRHLQDLPYFRALLRAVEARFYQDIPLVAPVL